MDIKHSNFTGSGFDLCKLVPLLGILLWLYWVFEEKNTTTAIIASVTVQFTVIVVNGYRLIGFTISQFLQTSHVYRLQRCSPQLLLLTCFLQWHVKHGGRLICVNKTVCSQNCAFSAQCADIGSYNCCVYEECRLPSYIQKLVANGLL